MQKRDAFHDTFESLRTVLAANTVSSGPLVPTVDKAGDYQVALPTRTDRTGRPLFIGAVQIKKNYVSFHLMPLYMSAELKKAVSPELRKRMQGKACFNFTSIEPAQLKELSALTKKGIARMKTLKLPWE